jgi:hypothetical protein
MAGIDLDHLSELVTEAWRIQAPKYLRAELDEGVLSSPGRDPRAPGRVEERDDEETR